MDTTKARISAIAEELEQKYGERVAMRFSGAVTVYTAQGIETPDCEDERIADVWPEAKSLIDADNGSSVTKSRYAEFDLLLKQSEAMGAEGPSEEERLLLELSDKTGVGIDTLNWLLDNYKGAFSREAYDKLPKSNLWGSYETFIRSVVIRLASEDERFHPSEMVPCEGGAVEISEELRDLFGILLDDIRKAAGDDCGKITLAELAGVYVATDRLPLDAEGWRIARDGAFGDLPSNEGELRDGDGSAAKRVYVSDVVDLHDIKRGKLNLIFAPCGCGKTYFVENTLKRNAQEKTGKDLLYLSPTISLREAVEHRGTPVESLDWNGFPVYEWKQDGITAMTYAAFGKRVYEAKMACAYRDKDWWNGRAIICLDELSQAVRQSCFPNGGGLNYTKIAFDEIVKRVRNVNNVVVTVSATPILAVNRFINDIHPVEMREEPVGYVDEKVERYDRLDRVLKSLDPSQRGIIYIRHIGQLLDAERTLRDRGIAATAIFSKHSKYHKMSPDRLKVIQTLVSEEKLPDDVQVLLINAAFETGLNIRPEKSRLDYVVVHESSEETQVQARGRYRGDIGVAYYKKFSDERPEHVIDAEAVAPYLERKLTAADTKELAGKLDLRDGRGRPLGWTSVKRVLMNQGYTVKSPRSSATRYTWIEE